MSKIYLTWCGAVLFYCGSVFLRGPVLDPVRIVVFVALVVFLCSIGKHFFNRDE